MENKAIYECVKELYEKKQAMHEELVKINKENAQIKYLKEEICKQQQEIAVLKMNLNNMNTSSCATRSVTPTEIIYITNGNTMSLDISIKKIAIQSKTLINQSRRKVRMRESKANLLMIAKDNFPKRYQ